MAKGPEPFIGKSIVVPVFLLLAQPDSADLIRRIFWRDVYMVAFVDNIPIGAARAMRNPGAAVPWSEVRRKLLG